jgi:four helix bundle protein
VEGLNRLEVYQAAMDLAKSIYQLIIPNLPSEEKWCLGTQIRRASASVPANIAEGYGRYYYQETIRFCYLARGSLMELMSHIELAKSQDFLSAESVLILSDKADRTLKLIHGYIKYLKRSKRGSTEPGSKISESSEGYVTNEIPD